MTWLSDRWGRGGPFGTIAGALQGNPYDRNVLGHSVADIGDAVAPFTGYWAPLVAGGANAIGSAIEPGTNFGNIATSGLGGAAEGYLGAGAVGGAEAANAAGSGLGGTIWGGVKGLGAALGLPTGATPASIGAGLPAGADSGQTAADILSGASSPASGIGVTPGTAPGISDLSGAQSGLAQALAGSPAMSGAGAPGLSGGGTDASSMDAFPEGQAQGGGIPSAAGGGSGTPGQQSSSFMKTLLKNAGPIGQGLTGAVNTAENAKRIGILSSEQALQQQQYNDEKKRQQNVAALLQPLYAQLIGRLQTQKTS